MEYDYDNPYSPAPIPPIALQHIPTPTSCLLHLQNKSLDPISASHMCFPYVHRYRVLNWSVRNQPVFQLSGGGALYAHGARLV